MNIGLTLSRNANRTPEKTAIIFEEETLSFQALNQEVNRLAHGLVKLGIQKGDHVAMMQMNTDQFAIVYYAIMKVGAVAVPMNVRLTASEVSYILKDSDSIAVFYDETFEPVIESAVKDNRQLQFMISTGATDLKGHTNIAAIRSKLTEEPDIEVEEKDNCQILYTSGTTGKPKGALFDHHRILHVGITVSITMQINPDDRLLHVAPLFHSAQLNLFLISGMYLGCTQVIQAQFDPVKVLTAMEQHKISLFFGIPTMYNFLLQVPNADTFDLSSVKRCGYGAAPMPVSILEQAMNLFGTDQFYNLCGLTEGGPGGVMLTPEFHNEKLGSGGKSLLNTEVKVVHENGRQIEPGETGEFILRSEMMMKRYYDKPEETAKTLKNGWLYTGDLATIDDDGFITLVDRKKDMIITGGENVYSVQVEDIIHGHPDVLEVAVVGEKDELWGEKVVAVVVPKAEKTINEETLKAFCRDKLAGYKVPVKYITAKEIPRNASGKVLKYQIRESLQSQPEEFI